MSYIEPDIGDDQATVLADITARIQAAVPGWLPVRGGLVYVLASGIAFVIAECYGVMRLLTRSIFRTYLNEVAGIPATPATASTGVATFASATSTFTVAAGTRVGVDDGAGGLIEFEVAAPVSTVDGSAENVQLVSIETGSQTAGLTGPVTVLDSLAYNPTVTITTATSGGTDGESDDDHLARGSERLRLSSDDVISGQDAAILARQIPGVYRALAVDNYEPPSNASAAGHITVALQEEDGTAVPAGVKTAVQAALDEASVIGLTVHLVDPVIEPVKVTYTATAYAGWDPATVQTQADAALAAYLASASWGSVPFGDARTWRQDTTVRYLEVAEVLNRVDGLDFITSLQIAKQANALGTVDVVLGTAPWTITSPGTITGTVTPGA